MSKNFVVGIFLLVLILALLWVMEPKKEENNNLLPSLEQSKQIAIKWIKSNSPTYLYDGYDLNLKEEKEIIKDIAFKFDFNFKTQNQGYGNRENKPVNQIKTHREMEIIIYKGKIMLAITDGVFCETEEKIIKNN